MATSINDIETEQLSEGFVVSYIPKFKNPDDYVDAKIDLLNQLCIYPTEDEIAYMRQFKTEISINNAYRAIINKYWG